MFLGLHFLKEFFQEETEDSEESSKPLGEKDVTLILGKIVLTEKNGFPALKNAILIHIFIQQEFVLLTKCFHGIIWITA